MRKKIAIIGASKGQLPLCLKAREMGLEVHSFAWTDGAVCKDVVDCFHPISITEKEDIIEECRRIGIDGVTSNASELTASVSSYIAGKLGLTCTPYDTICMIQDKGYVRNVTNQIEGLSHVRSMIGSPSVLLQSFPTPFVMKPVVGSSKKGVCFIDGSSICDDVDQDSIFLGEEYIEGQEYSIETISFRGEHQVVQVTEKESSGPPHFVELSHHQPAILSEEVKGKILKLIPEILTRIGFINGAAHTEIKVDKFERIFLIEVNPRGGGDYISNVLVGLSTDFDYLKAMLEVSLGCYAKRTINNIACSGVYFLSLQTERLMKWFQSDQAWIYEKQMYDNRLIESTSNYEHNGYLIYRSTHKIVL